MAKALPTATQAHQRDENTESTDTPCPVCFEDLKRTECAHFPCGHAVCCDCNATLLQRGFLSCPTCRTPRAGTSQGDVDHANQQRTLNDLEQEGAPMLLVSSQGQQYQVLFFPDEANVFPNPFLHVPNRANTTGVGINMGSPARDRSRLVPRTMQAHPYRYRPTSGLLQRYTERDVRAMGRTLRRHTPGDGTNHEHGYYDQGYEYGYVSETDDADEEAEANRGAGVRVTTSTNTPVTLDSAMSALVQGLLQPIDVPDFLARRRNV